METVELSRHELHQKERDVEACLSKAPVSHAAPLASSPFA
jgi:hypothetical protein